MQETGRYKIKLSALLYHQWFFLINWTIAAEFYATSFILRCFSFFGSYLIACPIFSPKFPVKRIQLVSFFSNDNSAQIILNWLFCWNFCTVGTRFCWWWQWTFLFCHFSFYSQSLHGNSSISAVHGQKNWSIPKFLKTTLLWYSYHGLICILVSKI